ncbi:hypothetical protein EX30DRAFT_372673 [Ascodesmis nigricans]|uniref:F-box domain-containing protein n=1 Tax=Ascodesmis nigricans TaxID=341454 RepID=A0A4S2MTR7_9PEZI|nr:hypothetical protein EX30DRAFT_372673 [Ascodesmis nigricans]
MTPETQHHPSPCSTLESLPYDILHIIITYLPNAHSLASLSATSRTVHRFCTTEGWRIFLTTHFPSLYPLLNSGYNDPHNAAACLGYAKRLTLLSRNHHRRSFSAHRLPTVSSPNTSRRRRRASNAQTLGFRPALATSDEGLFIAAGPDLVFHHTQPGHSFRSQRYGCPGHDDILSTALLPTGALIGQANGKLSHIHTPSSRITRTYETSHRSVRSLSVSPDLTTFSAALSGKTSSIRLYSTSPSSTGYTDLDLPTTIPLWTTTFLTPRTLLTATTSTTPIRIFDLTHNVQTRQIKSSPPSASTCVFSLSAIPASTSTFLAGWYSGATKLHDLRTPTDHVLTLSDPLDIGSAVYSLLPIDAHRVLVGTARHTRVKSFDLRMPKLGWGMFLPSSSGERKSGAVYSLAQIGVGGGNVFAGVEGAVWRLDFSQGVWRERGERGEAVAMYDWGREKGVRVWTLRGKGEEGEEEGDVDKRWKRVDAERGRGEVRR